MTPHDLHPARAAVVETVHGLLTWNIVALQDPPRVDDTATPSGNHQKESSAREIDSLQSGELEALRHLAWLTWAAAWWPAGRRIAPLAQALISAETAVTTAAVSHLLEDDMAVERALQHARDAEALAALLELIARVERSAAAGESAGADLASADLAGVAGALETDARALLEQLQDLSEDFGVSLTAGRACDATHEQTTEIETRTESDVSSTVREERDWALAAGATQLPGLGPLVAEGRTPIPWQGLPAGVLDAEADAVWSVHQQGGKLRLRATAAAAPEVTFPIPELRPTADLIAVYGAESLGVSAPMSESADSYIAEIELPAAAILLPPTQRRVCIGDPRFGRPFHSDPHAALVNELIQFAQSRLRQAKAGPDEYDLTIAERAAAWSMTGGAV